MDLKDLDRRLYAIERMLKMLIDKDAESDVSELSLSKVCRLTGRGYDYWKKEIENNNLPAKLEKNRKRNSYRIMIKDLITYNENKKKIKTETRPKDIEDSVVMIKNIINNFHKRGNK